MGIDYIYPQFEVVRDPVRCINCRLCEKQCANGVHGFDKDRGCMTTDESKCVNCQRCVCFCPTHALKIRKSDCTFRDNANWTRIQLKKSTSRPEAAACCCRPWAIPSVIPYIGTGSSSTPPR